MERVKVQSSNEGKTRSFEVQLVSLCQCSFIPQPNYRAIAPVFAHLVGDEQSLRAVVASIRTGRRLWLVDRKYQQNANSPYPYLDFIKKEKWVYAWQYFEEGASVQIFAKNYFEIEPGIIDDETIKFISIVPNKWKEDNITNIRKDMREFACDYFNVKKDNEIYDFIYSNLVEISTMYCMYLDRRVFVPILPDIEFQIKLFVECLKNRICAFGKETNIDYKDPYFIISSHLTTLDTFQHSLRQSNISSAIYCNTSHDAFMAVYERVISNHEY